MLFLIFFSPFALPSIPIVFIQIGLYGVGSLDLGFLLELASWFTMKAGILVETVGSWVWRQPGVGDVIGIFT